MNEEKETFLIVPYEKLSSQAFTGLVEEYILREGTDYGHGETTLDEKKQRVIKQLQAGHVQIVFSSVTEDCTIRLTGDLESRS